MERQPPKYEFLSKEKTKEMLKLFNGERTGWVQVGPQKWFFPYRYTEHGAGYYNFKARPDDTWVVTFPRSGTTWTQELVWLLSNNLDFETAKTQFLAQRFPFFEFSIFNHPEVTQEFLEINKGNEVNEQICRKIAKPGYEVLASIPSPRFIKTHFPLSLLPEILDIGCKVIYVARNPKDVAVSWYYMSVGMKTQGFLGDFATFWDYFENDLTYWGPYWTHLKEAWALKNHPNLLFLFYEDMQHDFLKIIRRIAKFLGKTYTDEQLNELADYLNINNFRNNPMVNSSELKNCKFIAEGIFIRKGVSGGWKDIFTPELTARADKWIEENLKNTDLRFPYFDNNN
ncbi:PREDICTED: sulfotransferase family cytosolic 1B member 1-like [Dinoponera quadriceps]|uniref:Sulfotransferase family cytosolic 1B member 1-like n=1 Tax=Dinoponera quadriceps TaxID=609295 RepID=A0A6P3X6W4_DINQU|nr:PREDICTED: sulfotransferase family cytosolic 1B member 1-like [Dinoponera quadriceps]